MPRFSNRGTSVIAAIVFAALLGAIALGLNAMQSGSQNGSALPAQAITAFTPAIGVQSTAAATQTTQVDDNQQTCAQAIQAAASSGAPTPQETITDRSENLKDSCNAAALDPIGSRITQEDHPSTWQSYTSSYQCVGKSGTVTTNADGTLTEKLKGDEQVSAGTCNVQTCNVSAAGEPANCKAAKPLAGINSSTLADSGGGAPTTPAGQPTVTPSTTLPAACVADPTSPACTAALSNPATAGSLPAACDSTSPSYNYALCAAAQSTTGMNSDQNPKPDYTLPSSDPNSNIQCYNNDNGMQECYTATSQDQTNLQNQGYTCTPATATSDAVCTKSTSASPQQTCSNGATNPPACNISPCVSGSSGSCTPTPTPTPTCQKSGTCGQTQQPQTQTWYCLTSYEPLKWNIVQAATSPGSNCSTTQPQSGAPTTQNQQHTGGGSTFGQPQTTQPQSGQQNGQQTCSTLASLFGCQNQPQISCQLNVQPNPAQTGLPATLTWTSTGNVYSAQISNVGSVPPSGSYTIYPTATTNYSMTIADQNNNQGQCNVAVNVTRRTGCTGTGSCTSAQTPYGVGTNGQACSQPPAQPPASSCTVGSWHTTSATNNGCITGYQCAPSGSASSTTPAAQISCAPQVADVGESVAVSYSCANSTTSTGGGFSTGNQMSGSATVIVAAPPAGTNTGTYSLTCSTAAQTSSAQCSIQIDQPTIVLLANPKDVAAGQPSTIGWVTAGMKSCVVSSPTDAAFTASNANNFTVNGVAQTSAITAPTEYDLSCITIGGGAREASTTVQVSR